VAFGSGSAIPEGPPAAWPDASLDGAPPAADLPAATAAACVARALPAALAAVALRDGRPFDLLSSRALELVGYPYWVQYHRRGTRYSLAALDGLSGARIGSRGLARLVVTVAALVQEDRGAPARSS
jgi:hypothetical protein